MNGNVSSYTIEGTKQTYEDIEGLTPDQSHELLKNRFARLNKKFDEIDAVLAGIRDRSGNTIADSLAVTVKETLCNAFEPLNHIVSQIGDNMPQGE